MWVKDVWIMRDMEGVKVRGRLQIIWEGRVDEVLKRLHVNEKNLLYLFQTITVDQGVVLW